MSEIPEGLSYSRSHEWLREEPDGSLSCGITDHAQSALGDLVFVELPEPGRQVTAGEAIATVESTKAASDVYAPVAGEVVAVNDALESEPGLVNNAPYGEGWLLKLRPAASVSGLLDAGAYRAHLESAAD